MAGAKPREEEHARLTGARADFVSSLPRRLEILRGSLRKLEQGPRDPSVLNGLLRRLHALGSAARVLGFASVAEALAEAEKVLRRAPKPGPGAAELTEVARSLDLLPSLVLGAPVVLRTQAADPSPADVALGRVWPLSVVVVGPQGLVDALTSEGLEIECERTEDLSKVEDLTRVVGPDAVVIDIDRPGSRELVQKLTSNARHEPVPLIAIGDFGNPEVASSFVAAGASRVLPKPVSPDTLVRTVLELHEQPPQARPVREPLGSLSVAELAERLASELRRGLVDAAEPSARATSVAFGEGADVMAAVWGAVARVRDLVTVRSSGAVRFEATGPEGAVPFAAWGLEERRAGDRGARHAREAEGIPLQGRRVVVADDDPAVVWFLTGLLKAVGAEVLEAYDGERALELTYERWPDLVVSDVLMPKLDGFSLCHEIKRDVAVRDVPVILLSWKEDLLQRVRELGADADGYLRKEAAASTVVERLREVLRPRARVEERLSSGGEVRGRLDGLTPRLVLELACRGRRDVRIGVRDAVYLYELQVREGRLRSATRSASDGTFERGEGVLSALLGVSAGRFVVAPDTSPCRADFQGGITTLLRGPIAGARAAQRAVSAAGLVRVERLELEAEKIGGYLACTPEPARALLERIIGGASPRELITSGNVGAGLLEAVLSDFARRGAIKAATLEGGERVDFAAIAAEAARVPQISDPEPEPDPPSVQAEPPAEPPPAEPAASAPDEPQAAKPEAEAPPPSPAVPIPTTTAVIESPDLSDWELPPDFLNVLTSQKPDAPAEKAAGDGAKAGSAEPEVKPPPADDGAGWTLAIEPTDAPAPAVESSSSALPFNSEPTPGFVRSDPPRGEFPTDVEVGTLRGVGPIPVKPVAHPISGAPPPPRPAGTIDVDSEDALTAVLTEATPLPSAEPADAAPPQLSPEDALDVVLGVKPALGQTLPLPGVVKPPAGVRTEVLSAVTLPSTPPDAEPASAVDEAAEESAASPEKAETAPPAAKGSSGARSNPGLERPAASPPAGSGGSVARTLLVALLAFGASFFLVRWVVWPSFSAEPAAELAPQPASPAVVAAPANSALAEPAGPRDAAAE